MLGLMAQAGTYLPRTAFTYFNLGPLRQTGVELWLDQRFSRELAASVNYSWQSEPEILDDPNPFLASELNLPPTHRFNAEVNWNGSRLLGAASVNAATDAFWSDVLSAGFHGYTDGYATVNGSFGVKWQGGRIITTVKVNNLFNQTIQQHIFGDLLRRTVIGEIKFRL
ncbi:MAG: TonB-dependent receptor [Acidobacteria bacterium]|nr:TonB-dependent receptor [Acidobacteriota bacterium]